MTTKPYKLLRDKISLKARAASSKKAKNILTEMNYREQIFKTKFKNASKYLGVDPDQIISLKLRDMVSSYSEYHEMLQTLEHEVGIKSSSIDDDFQGRGHLVTQDNQKIIIVEHETGLEILYITGSISSLITLIPLVMQAWGAIRGHLGRRHNHHIQSVEIRRIDANGGLHEDRTQSDNPTSALLTAARFLESDLQSLRREAQAYKKRLVAVENELKRTKGIKAKKGTSNKKGPKAPKRNKK